MHNGVEEVTVNDENHEIVDSAARDESHRLVDNPYKGHDEFKTIAPKVQEINPVKGFMEVKGRDQVINENKRIIENDPLPDVIVSKLRSELRDQTNKHSVLKPPPGNVPKHSLRAGTKLHSSLVSLKHHGFAYLPPYIKFGAIFLACGLCFTIIFNAIVGKNSRNPKRKSVLLARVSS